MHYFTYRGNKLYCEDLSVKDLARKFTTPLYIYSARTILHHFYKIKRAFTKITPLICYSVKANSNLSILKLLVDNGAGLDIVSGGELYRAKKVGCPGEKIVYASVGKTEKEIKEAIDYGILMFNVESLPELLKINGIGSLLKKRISIALRINPEVDVNTHKYVNTSGGETKFGMDLSTVKTILEENKKYPFVDIVGVHFHLGSQITEVEPFIEAIRKVLEVVEEVEESKGVTLKYFNIGGGLGIVYDKEQPQEIEVFAERISSLLEEKKFRVILEPGRFIVGNSGILVTRVLYVKDATQKRFIIVDAGMNDLIRPALYNAYHKILPVELVSSSNKKKADVVGPVCETADFLGKDRDLDVKEGDYLAVFGCGAYGVSMSSNYNSRLRPSEILVKEAKAYLIRERECYEDLLQKEKIVSV